MENEEKNDELKTLQLKCEEYLNGWKRERADFLNYKKEEMEKISSLVKYANEELILKLLPVLDNLCLAEKHIPDNKEFAEGFLQIKKQLSDFLQKEGIEPIRTIGEAFNPEFMEVVEEVSDDSGLKEIGTVIEEIQRGYTLHGKLIRVARVKISK
ncbi:MAG: nucleotide exchange factor GrpE [Candidatus Staskawiczbacteria bacterium RIFOXYB1_FULL_37_44]|uniref:Protein GrpE n=1 Tax=Candidatus Staskawiczbacteria bacterium RIFOXYB1_FULL_37_44 TaxID=1802223 RepID=A0A1G2IWB4_9BACT|nr:MAG: nucleotide exchange factor GrpE [Candidatus Staskawiczbacteria bacterium RIFOXYB1_FULL_37_44]OGZ83815.1 MAG: nucleotide exchange factor GrpE [Candidatus Staskawiczbacteria bacterium RIFOXYC1_FULL_37_52]OGZ88405.1 MAG: nucleotide exchange factor GrpE [Candidatus Staskawiczbacteria bacterium RIFOXYC2_FULL_37_19]